MLLDGLKRVGYNLNFGDDGSGFLFLALKRAGGYYLGMELVLFYFACVEGLTVVVVDVGAAQMIVDGKIKIKNNTQIERYTKTGLKFTDGTELDADVVLYATGYVPPTLLHVHIHQSPHVLIRYCSFGEIRDLIKKICGDEVRAKCPPIWGLNEEGELNGTWREIGTPGLWYMMGMLSHSSSSFAKLTSCFSQATSHGADSSPSTSLCVSHAMVLRIRIVLMSCYRNQGEASWYLRNQVRRGACQRVENNSPRTYLHRK